MAGWLAGWLAGSLGCAGWLGGWLANWLPDWKAGLLVGQRLVPMASTSTRSNNDMRGIESGADDTKTSLRGGELSKGQ